MKINVFNKVAIEKKFPFMKEMWKLDDYFITEFSVAKATRDFLNHVPMVFYEGEEREHIHFVLENGEIIFYAVYQGYDDEDGYGETIIHAIERHGIAERVIYIVTTYIDYKKNKNNTCEVRKVNRDLITELISASYKDAEEEVAKYDEI